MYNPDAEKQYILNEINGLEPSSQFYFQQAIEFANSELKELANALDRFEDKIQHLAIYDIALKDPLHDYLSQILKRIKLLINNEPTDLEIEKMNQEDYHYYLKLQDIRMKLLQKISKNYLGGKS